MERTPHNIELIADRLDRNTELITRMEDNKASKESVGNLVSDINDLKRAVAGLQKLLIGFIISAAVVAITFGLACLELVAQSH